MDSSAREESLERTIREIERHVAGRGWQVPPAVFALVRTAPALSRDPALASELPAEVIAAAERDPEHLTSVEQEALPAAQTLEELLGRLAWPETVDGAAVVVERVLVPPEAAEELPAKAEEAATFLENHPGREDVRIAAGVLRTGESWCTVRFRKHDADDAVAGSPDAVPALVDAVRATLL